MSLLSHQTDIAVHSLKDLTTVLPDGLALAAVCERVAVEDVLLVRDDHRVRGILALADLPAGAVLGTSSLRRRALLARAHPHLRVADVRGNLQTRYKKLESGQYDALVLAQAGVVRLGWQERIAQVLPCTVFPHAVGQAALGIVCRTDDARAHALLACLDHRDTRWRCAAERALLRALEGGCKVPIAASTEWRAAVNDSASAANASSTATSSDGGARELVLRGVVISTDGAQIVDHTAAARVTCEADAVVRQCTLLVCSLH